MYTYIYIWDEGAKPRGLTNQATCHSFLNLCPGINLGADSPRGPALTVPVPGNWHSYWKWPVKQIDDLPIYWCISIYIKHMAIFNSMSFNYPGGYGKKKHMEQLGVRTRRAIPTSSLPSASAWLTVELKPLWSVGEPLGVCAWYVVGWGYACRQTRPTKT